MLENEMLEDEMDEDESNLPNLAKPLRGKADWLIPQQCRDCLFRYREFFIIDGRKIKCDESDGWQKDCCTIYPDPKCKPQQVLRNTDECECYEKDEDAPARE